MAVVEMRTLYGNDGSFERNLSAAISRNVNPPTTNKSINLFFCDIPNSQPRSSSCWIGTSIKFVLFDCYYLSQIISGFHPDYLFVVTFYNRRFVFRVSVLSRIAPSSKLCYYQEGDGFVNISLCNVHYIY